MFELLNLFLFHSLVLKIKNVGICCYSASSGQTNEASQNRVISGKFHSSFSLGTLGIVLVYRTVISIFFLFGTIDCQNCFKSN